MRGYFGIGVYHLKNGVNLGTLWRSAYQLGASFIFTIGKRYKFQSSDKSKAYLHIPLFTYATLDEFKLAIPMATSVVGVEIGGRPLKGFVHPERAVYLLGAEDYGLSKEAMDCCKQIVEIETVNQQSYNVSVAGSIVMYSRLIGK